MLCHVSSLRLSALSITVSLGCGHVSAPSLHTLQITPNHETVDCVLCFVSLLLSACAPQRSEITGPWSFLCGTLVKALREDVPPQCGVQASPDKQRNLRSCERSFNVGPRKAGLETVKLVTQTCTRLPPGKNNYHLQIRNS